eukprot:CAMPEP_0182418486 /NCGR_PEP_ID=MMETSP1167-20130531/2900_1 /TAXON_ID=2988 /ORGANISM="Mallomonas Sp, Strain CCMP3275" /LENGTH=218 /DNA_ID=CAMNT_0024592709 /DNA_START=212 /DNA_END=865 /DNA_ORIENTATION=+
MVVGAGFAVVGQSTFPASTSSLRSVAFDITPDFTGQSCGSNQDRLNPNNMEVDCLVSRSNRFITGKYEKGIYIIDTEPSSGSVYPSYHLIVEDLTGFGKPENQVFKVADLTVKPGGKVKFGNTVITEEGDGGFGKFILQNDGGLVGYSDANSDGEAYYSAGSNPFGCWGGIVRNPDTVTGYDAAIIPTTDTTEVTYNQCRQMFLHEITASGQKAGVAW